MIYILVEHKHRPLLKTYIKSLHAALAENKVVRVG